MFFSTDAAVTFSDTVGFTLREQSTLGGDMACLTRVIQSGDTSFTILVNEATTRGVACMVVYSGTIDFITDAIESGAGPAHTTATLSPGAEGWLFLGCFFRDSAVADPVTGVVASGNTTIRSNTYRSSQGHLVVADVIKGDSDATSDQLESSSYPDTGTYGEYVMTVSAETAGGGGGGTSQNMLMMGVG